MDFSAVSYTGELVAIRALRPSDKPEYRKHGGHPEAIRLYGGDPSTGGPRTEEQANRWLQGRPGSIKWGIERGCHIIGIARLDDVNETDRNARFAIGIWLPENWGKGFGTDAARLVLKYGFEMLGLHRIDLIVLVMNKRAIRSYEKAGFKQEGVLRERASIDGRWEDDILMSMLEQEYFTRS